MKEKTATRATLPITALGLRQKNNASLAPPPDGSRQMAKDSRSCNGLEKLDFRPSLYLRGLSEDGPPKKPLTLAALLDGKAQNC